VVRPIYFGSLYSVVFSIMRIVKAVGRILRCEIWIEASGGFFARAKFQKSIIVQQFNSRTVGCRANMSIIYMPSERCPKCPFNTLCKEEQTCPISRNSPVNPLDIKEELRQFSKTKPYQTTMILGPSQRE